MTDGVCAPKGFVASGVAAGIKPNADPDVAVVVSESFATAAGVFTRNVVQAAPVTVSRQRLETGDRFRAVVVSSGNANAATGQPGIDVAEAMCATAAEGIGCRTEEVLISQTGLIGIPLDGGIASAGVGEAVARASRDGAHDAARAMLTTDTVEKIAVESFRQGDREVTVGGMAKGAAMLAPSMATMLAIVTTDAAAQPEVLRRLLGGAMRASFHSIVVDGCMSTNDTVYLLANGAAGAPVIDSRFHPAYPGLSSAVTSVCRSLALKMVADAEGATKLMRVDVTGAATGEDATRVARSVVGSLLVKCSLAGEDPYWGRVLADAGASGADFDPGDCTVSYGGTIVCRGGVAADHDVDVVATHMTGREVEIGIDLGAGDGSATMWGSDLTHDYVDENMGTS